MADESDTSNNCSASVQVTVPEPDEPDLVVAAPTVSNSTPAVGATFTLSVTVQNDGDGASAATTLRYYRSMDATITISDTEVGTDTVAELAASGTSSVSVDVTAPAVAGTYYYGACVDAVADESDTSNNCSASVQVTVPEPDEPDLVVAAPTVSNSTPVVGTTFTLSVRVEGAEDGPATMTLEHLPFDRRNDHEIGYACGHSSGETGHFGEQPPSGSAGSVDDPRTVLCR